MNLIALTYLLISYLDGFGRAPYTEERCYLSSCFAEGNNMINVRDINVKNSLKLSSKTTLESLV